MFIHLMCCSGMRILIIPTTISAGFRQGQIVDGNTELINFTTTNDLNSYTDKYRTEGYFTRLNYNFNEKYFFSASYRHDASSKFFKENRWGDFWSVSAAWRMDAEEFHQIAGLD